MKRFTVTFPVARHDEQNYILLGSQPEGKPLHGYLNGYGGKVNDDETLEEAAKRELVEELGVTADNLQAIGSIIHEAKEVFFYLTTAEFREYTDSAEMEHNTWYVLNDSAFIESMLPGDQAIIEHIRNEIEKYWAGETMNEFRIEKVGEEIKRAVRGLDDSLKFK